MNRPPGARRTRPASSRASNRGNSTRHGEPGTFGEHIQIAIPFRREQGEQSIVFRGGACARSCHGGGQPELLEHVGSSLHQAGAVPEERVTAPMTAAEDAAGHRHHVATLLERTGRRDERAAPIRRLDHHDPSGEPTDDAVPLREVRRQRWGAGRQFGDDRAGVADPLVQPTVFCGIHHVGTAPQHRNGQAARVKSAPVCRGITSAREPADHRDTGGRQIVSEPLSHLRPAGGRGTGPDHRHAWGAERGNLASHPEHDGRLRNLAEARREARIGERDHSDSRCLRATEQLVGL